jgi:hypothetical protein
MCVLYLDFLVKCVFSSWVQGLECNVRDMLLDDALFGFFRKKAVKSLKRNFSDFWRDVSASTKV